jgi:hypothetical protein
MARRLLRTYRRPVILIDWTQTVGDFNALVAAVAFSGRALPLYAEVHPGEKLGSRDVQGRFLANLAKVLPPKNRPVIVADAGFKTPFFEAVRGMNWSFVVRLRGKGVLRRASTNVRLRDPRMSFDTAFALAADQAQDLGVWTPYAAAGALGADYRIVLASRPAKADHRRRDDPYARRAVEPWLLATDLINARVTQIVDLYALRMQIELTFRDAKNGRMGWGLEQARSSTAGRQSVLLLIASSRSPPRFSPARVPRRKARPPSTRPIRSSPGEFCRCTDWASTSSPLPCSSRGACAHSSPNVGGSCAS